MAGSTVAIGASGVSMGAQHHAANKWRKEQGLRPRNFWSGKPEKEKVGKSGRRIHSEMLDLQNRVTKPGVRGTLKRVKRTAGNTALRVLEHPVGMPLAVGGAVGGLTTGAAYGTAKLYDKATGKKPIGKAATTRLGSLSGLQHRVLAQKGKLVHRDMAALQGKATKVGKARRFDSEADRQRRIGYIGGGALGAGIVTGEAARRSIEFGHGKGISTKTKKPYRSFSVTSGKKGALLAAGTVGLGAVSLGALKHGVSERNRTWT